MSARHFISAAVLVNLFFVLPVFAAEFISEPEKGLFKEHAIQTQHFQFEYSDIVEDQADGDGDGIPDLIEVIAEAAEYSWEKIVQDWGYEDPIPEGFITVILDDNDEYLSSGALGVTSTLSNGEPYIAIDPWMSEDYLVITMGHEFFHAVQFGYDSSFAYTSQGISWAEETATWMEDQLFDDVNDYAYYIPDFFDYADYSLFATLIPSNTLYEYGMNIWPRFLGEYYDPFIVKDIWESYLDSSESFDSDLKLHDAVAEVVKDEGDTLPELFQEFTLWNLSLEDYEEGELYPQVLILDGEESENYILSDETFAPALYGTNYLYFPNNRDKENFHFHIVKTMGVSYAISLVPYDGENYDLSRAVQVIVKKDNEMEEALELENLGKEGGVAVVISPLEVDFEKGNNWGIYDQGYTYYYLADFGMRDEEFQNLMQLTGETDLPDEEEEQGKEGEEAEQTPDVRSQDTLSLSLINFDEDSATFSWNQLSNDDVHHYKLNYGQISGVHSKSFETENDYTTFATIESLEEGEAYYFQLEALDEDGDPVLDPSSELTVTPAAWIFKDVSFVDEHYGAIQALVDEGIFSGYANGTFQAEKDINRAELLKILIESQEDELDASVYKNCYPDVHEEWFAKYVCYAKAKGYIKGYPDGLFRPAQTVNKVEALKMLFTTYGLTLSEEGGVAKLNYSDLDPNAWYAIYVWKASSLGILDETLEKSFRPSEGRNRGDMAEELYRYLVVIEELKE